MCYSELKLNKDNSQKVLQYFESLMGKKVSLIHHFLKIIHSGKDMKTERINII